MLLARACTRSSCCWQSPPASRQPTLARAPQTAALLHWRLSCTALQELEAVLDEAIAALAFPVSPTSHCAPTSLCLPPQELKAALDEAIAALARRPDLAAALWERLAAAVVVAPATAETAAVPRYDLSYQLNEIEVGGRPATPSLHSELITCGGSPCSSARLAHEQCWLQQHACSPLELKAKRTVMPPLD